MTGRGRRIIWKDDEIARIKKTWRSCRTRPYMSFLFDQCQLRDKAGIRRPEHLRTLVQRLLREGELEDLPVVDRPNRSTTVRRGVLRSLSDSNNQPTQNDKGKQAPEPSSEESEETEDEDENEDEDEDEDEDGDQQQDENGEDEYQQQDEDEPKYHVAEEEEEEEEEEHAVNQPPPPASTPARAPQQVTTHRSPVTPSAIPTAATTSPTTPQLPVAFPQPTAPLSAGWGVWYHATCDFLIISAVHIPGFIEALIDFLDTRNVLVTQVVHREEDGTLQQSVQEALESIHHQDGRPRDWLYGAPRQTISSVRFSLPYEINTTPLGTSFTRRAKVVVVMRKLEQVRA